MSAKIAIQNHIKDSIAVKQKVLQNLVAPIEKCADRITESLKNRGKILLCGNGGSAADSQHLAAELVVRLRGSFNRPAIAALALTVDSSILTAAGNDFGYDQIFARQIEALAKKEDLLIALSTSGNSGNIIEAVKQARAQELFVVGFLGGTGGQLADMVDLSLVVPSNSTAHIQEAHIMIGHILCELVEENLFK